MPHIPPPHESAAGEHAEHERSDDYRQNPFRNSGEKCAYTHRYLLGLVVLERAVPPVNSPLRRDMRLLPLRRKRVSLNKIGDYYKSVCLLGERVARRERKHLARH